MPSYRRTAIAVGVLLIACSTASILSGLPLGSMLDSPVNLARLAANGNRVVLAALIAFMGAATGAGIAIGPYPVLRKYNSGHDPQDGRWGHEAGQVAFLEVLPLVRAGSHRRVALTCPLLAHRCG
jgi:hypothetical protein